MAQARCEPILSATLFATGRTMRMSVLAEMRTEALDSRFRGSDDSGRLEEDARNSICGRYARLVEWLQYGQRLTGFVSELIEDAGELKGKEMAAVLMVIDALVSRGLDCAMQTHTQLVQHQLHAATIALATG